jgi:uncharacterized membrane protein HdeD (DUF308 family)
VFIVLGIVFIIFGVLIIKDPVYCRGVCVDLGNSSMFVGSLCIAFGILCIWSDLRKRMKKKWENK